MEKFYLFTKSRGKIKNVNLLSCCRSLPQTRMKTIHDDLQLMIFEVAGRSHTHNDCSTKSACATPVAAQLFINLIGNGYKLSSGVRLNWKTLYKITKKSLPVTGLLQVEKFRQLQVLRTIILLQFNRRPATNPNVVAGDIFSWKYRHCSHFVIVNLLSCCRSIAYTQYQTFYYDLQLFYFSCRSNLQVDRTNTFSALSKKLVKLTCNLMKNAVFEHLQIFVIFIYKYKKYNGKSCSVFVQNGLRLTTGP